MKNTLKITLIVLLASISHLSYSQMDLEKHLIGQWSVKGNYDLGAPIPENAKKEIEMVQSMFAQSKFTFKTDHSFKLEVPVPDMALENGYWEVLKDNNDVIIKEWKDRNNSKSAIHMGLKVLIKNGKTIFLIEETFFAFEMQKI